VTMKVASSVFVISLILSPRTTTAAARNTRRVAFVSTGQIQRNHHCRFACPGRFRASPFSSYRLRIS